MRNLFLMFVCSVLMFGCFNPSTSTSSQHEDNAPKAPSGCSCDGTFLCCWNGKIDGTSKVSCLRNSYCACINDPGSFWCQMPKPWEQVPPRTADAWDTWYQEHVRPGEKVLVDDGADCTWDGDVNCCKLDDRTECTDYSLRGYCESSGGVWDAASSTCSELGW